MSIRRSRSGRLWAGAAAILAVIVLASSACQDAGPTITVSPNSGPGGTEATITITGALPNSPVTLMVQPPGGSGSSTNLNTDASGNASTRQIMDFPVGPVEIRALIGAATQQDISTTFTQTQS